MRPIRTIAAALFAFAFVAASTGCSGKPKAADIKGIVQVSVTEDGFSPDKIAAKRGQPLTLVFHRKTDKTCATEVVIASEHIRQALPLDKDQIVTFIPEKTGDVPFACPMNMVKGSITVIP